VTNMTEIRCSIRRARSSDAPKILELYRELDDLHRERNPELVSDTFARDLASVEQALKDQGTAFFVAEIQDASPKIVGFVQAMDSQVPAGRVLAERRFGLVDALMVSPASRRNGVATALLGAAEEWALARGLDALEVTVWEFNDAGHALYERQGFTPLRRYLRKPLVR
jgi:ribosomal protein S18 acetylase RimI-like enzyme